MTPTKRIIRLATRSAAGYSIVELAIALAVIGVILGGLAIPIGNQLRESTYREANRQVAEAVDAVVGYATTHKTPGFPILYTFYVVPSGQSGRYHSRAVAVPAGRPYLPCPDIDFDGLEDRNELVRPSDYRVPLLLDTTARSRFVLVNRALRDPLDQASNSLSNPLGDCMSYRGTLPWRTLGLKPNDPWGSGLTYIVSPLYSVAAYGFDQLTRGTSFSPWLLTGTTYQITSSSRAFADVGVSDALPLVVCGPPEPQQAATTCPLEQILNDDSSNSWSLVSDRRGSVVASPISLHGYSFARSAGVRRVTDGLPFAIISHGLNRLGAYTEDSDGNSVCATAATTRIEMVNSSHCDTADTFFSSLYRNSVNQERIEANTATSFSYYNWIFAVRRASLDRGNTGVVSEYDFARGSNTPFDDVVGWITRRELLHRLRREGVLPVETFAGLYALHPAYEL